MESLLRQVKKDHMEYEAESLPKLKQQLITEMMDKQNWEYEKQVFYFKDRNKTLRRINFDPNEMRDFMYVNFKMDLVDFYRIKMNDTDVFRLFALKFSNLS